MRKVLAKLFLTGIATALLMEPAVMQPAWSGTGRTRVDIAINGMVCSFCAQGIEKKLKSLPGAQSVDVDLHRRLVSITFRSGSSVADANLRKLIRDAGFDVRQIQHSSLDASEAP